MSKLFTTYFELGLRTHVAWYLKAPIPLRLPPKAGVVATPTGANWEPVLHCCVPCLALCHRLEAGRRSSAGVASMCRAVSPVSSGVAVRWPLARRSPSFQARANYALVDTVTAIVEICRLMPGTLLDVDLGSGLGTGIASVRPASGSCMASACWPL